MSHTSFGDLFTRVRTRSSFERGGRSSLESKRSSSYSSYGVHQQEMLPAILRKPEITKRILEHLAELPNGKRALSRVARACKALHEPAIEALWKDLDSLVPLIGLFPSKLLKRAKRPGLGLAKSPSESDWDRVLYYANRVQRLTYNESLNNVAPSVFSTVLLAPRQFLFPNLKTLVWRCDTPAGLERALTFMNTKLESFTLEINRAPRLEQFLKEMPKRTKLVNFTIVSTTALPQSFPEVMAAQDNIESLVFVIPGALSPAMGGWMAKLPSLKSLQLDLTARSTHSIESFFEETGLRSGCSTPTSFSATDSGVFTGSDDVDSHDVRKDLRKAALKLTGDYRSQTSRTSPTAFAALEELQLTGDAGNAAVFLKHLRNPVSSLSLVIEDPPDRHDWQDLSVVVSERFGDSLESLRVTTNTPPRPESTRFSSKSEVGQRLSLKHFSDLSVLKRLEIDLHYSYQFDAGDISRLSEACPGIESIKLCPTAKYPLAGGPPQLTLEDLVPLTERCRSLNTLSIALNATTTQSADEILASRGASSTSLRQLHLGHSWAKDPLDTAIILSHLAPHLDVLRYFHEATRPGVIPSHAQTWQKVIELLPHLQRIRLAERRATEEQFASRNPASQTYSYRLGRQATTKSLKSVRSVLESILESPMVGDGDSSVFIYPGAQDLPPIVTSPPQIEAQRSFGPSIRDDGSSVFIYGPQTPINYLAPVQFPPPVLREPVIEVHESESPTLLSRSSTPAAVAIVKVDAEVDATIPEIAPLYREHIESWVQAELPVKRYSSVNTSVTNLLPLPPPPPVLVETAIQAEPTMISVSIEAVASVTSVSIGARPITVEREVEQDVDLMEKPPVPPPTADSSVQAMPAMVSASTETIAVTTTSTSVDATPALVDREVESIPELFPRPVTPPPVPQRHMSETGVVTDLPESPVRKVTPPTSPLPPHLQRVAWPPIPGERERTMSTATDATAVEIPTLTLAAPITKIGKHVRHTSVPSILLSGSPPKHRVSFEPTQTFESIMQPSAGGAALEPVTTPTLATTTSSSTTTETIGAKPSSFWPKPVVSDVTNAAKGMFAIPMYFSSLAMGATLDMLSGKESRPPAQERIREVASFEEMGIVPFCM